MKKIFLVCYLFLSGILHSQNWNVFNKGYRYNYKYNYSSLVSNVLFVDTVKQSGADTIYTLNRIGVECTGSCPTITAALTPSVTYVVPNMPQFLQRCIKKYSNGLVQLYDTTKIIIVPTSTLNQTWLFDSIYNKTAVCISISTLNIFGNTDSVKTILIQNVDTLILSKSFGIILFPDPYAKNKYYRLAGIENKASYDLTSLYGEKVPNAWDFYNYDVGDSYCYETCNNSYGYNPGSTGGKGILTVNGKSITPTGYNYNYSSALKTNTFACWFPPGYPYTLSNYTSTMALTSPTLVENLMYPNMLYTKIPIGPSGAYNIVKFANDNFGTFYKYYGQPCSPYFLPLMPNANAVTVLQYTNNGIYISYNSNVAGEKIALCLGVGFGKITEKAYIFEDDDNYCLTGFTKNNIPFGTCINDVGILENNPDTKNTLIYPNPANNILHLQIPEGCTIEIINIFGEKIFNKTSEQNEKIDISNFANGIYFVSLKNLNFSYKQKVIVKH